MEGISAILQKKKKKNTSELCFPQIKHSEVVKKGESAGAQW
jgi:hypothetical protein